MFCNVRKVAQSLTTDPANSSSNQQRCSLLLFTIHSIYQRESGIANNSSFKSTKLAVLKRNVFKGIERHKAQNRDTPSTILISLLFLLVTIPNKRVREKGQRERDQHPYFSPVIQSPNDPSLVRVNNMIPHSATVLSESVRIIIISFHIFFPCCWEQK